MYDAFNGHADVVKLLFDKGFNPNAPAIGYTPPFVAGKYGYYEIAGLLFTRGAK